VENELLAEARSERGEVTLIRRGRDHGVELRVNGVFVMDDVETSSERMLARAAMSALPDRTLDVLVGGLGLGFTLTAVLEDVRVRRVVVADTEPGSIDVVLLDVDNGPGYLVYDANAAVYRDTFLRGCAATLRPGGLTAIWSAAPAPDLLATLEAVYASAEEWTIPVILGQRATTYHLFLGRVGD